MFKAGEVLEEIEGKYAFSRKKEVGKLEEEQCGIVINAVRTTFSSREKDKFDQMLLN